MICFPLDNTPYEAKDMGVYLATRTRGVFCAEGNLAVTPGAEGLTVTVSPGLAWLKWSAYWGTAALQEQALTLQLEMADGVLSRIDAIVCRLDKINNRAEIIAKKGAFSSAPIVLPPVRDANYDELYLATVLVGAGSVSVTPADITDQRLNETYCGLMRDGVTGIPTQQLYAQWAAFCAQTEETFDSWFGRIKEQFTEDAVGGLQTQIDALGKSTQESLAQKADAAEVQTALAGKAAAAHTHDDRYFTESEVTAALNGKANTSHTHTKAQVGLGNVDNTADSAKSVKYAASAGSAVDQTARNSAASANTNANNRMPIAGGTFTGRVVAAVSYGYNNSVFNGTVRTSNWGDTGNNVHYIAYLRK